MSVKVSKLVGSLDHWDWNELSHTGSTVTHSGGSANWSVAWQHLAGTWFMANSLNTCYTETGMGGSWVTVQPIRPLHRINIWQHNLAGEHLSLGFTYLGLFLWIWTDDLVCIVNEHNTLKDLSAEVVFTFFFHQHHFIRSLTACQLWLNEQHAKHFC